MLKDRERLYQVYHSILNMSLTWALILVINRYYELRIGINISFIFALVPAFIIYLFQKKNILRYLILAGIFPVLGLLFFITKTIPTVWIKNLLLWCNVYNGSEELYVAQYAYLLLFVIAMVSAIIINQLTANQMTKLFLAVMLIIGMVILSINKIEINKVVVAICIFYILSILVELCGILYNKKEGRAEKKEGILYLAPICLLISLLVVLLPSKSVPIEWKFFKNIYQNVSDQFEIWKTELKYYFGDVRSEFSVSLTGFTEENNNLEEGGNLLRDHKVAMKLTGLDQNEAVYLSGSISNIYTGIGWEKSREDYIPKMEEFRLDFAELFYALGRQNKEDIENNSFLDEKYITLVYHNIKTKTFFYPLKMESFSMISNVKKMLKETPQINFSKARGKGTSYSVNYYEMNLESEAFKQILRDEDDFSYDTYQSINKEMLEYIKKNIYLGDNVDYLIQRTDYYTKLKDRAKMIKEQYTKLPNNLPERVYALAEEIAKEKTTDYDRLKAIEDYLLTNYIYSMETTKVPKGQDFIDYFLFDYKQGYCTSYASAMAILGRCLGIPTRYVEGFLARTSVKDDDNRYLIRNSQAHAWAEAYIEGVGWIPFEATPPYVGYRYTAWPEKVKEGEATDQGMPLPYASYHGEILDESSKGIENLATQEENRSEETITTVLFFTFLLVILILLIITYYFALYVRYQRVYKKADYSRKSYMLFLRILYQLKREGFALQPQETILMMAERIKKHLPEGIISFNKVADIFMRYRYAQEELTAEDFKLVDQFYRGLITIEMERESRFKVFLGEFLFLTSKHKY